MKRIVLSILAFSLMCLSACREEKHDDPTPVVTNTIPEGVKQWFGSVTDKKTDTVAAHSGYMYLSSNQKDGKTHITQMSSMYPLQGDFELKIKYSDFMTVSE
jgi:hypothetical protein